MSEQIAQQCDNCVCLFSCCVSGKVQHVRPCPLHAAAPALLEALEELESALIDVLKLAISGPNYAETIERASAAIVAAELAKGEN